MAGEVRFGIIGCGVIGPTHAEAIARTDGARLVAVADEDPQRARELADRYGVQALAPQELVGRPDIDAVCVCTPTGTHAAVALAAIEAGKHVLVEKPMDVSLAAADRMIDAARRKGVVLGGVLQRRFDPDARRLKEEIERGRLGRLYLGVAVMPYYRSQSYYDSAEWRGTWALDGGGALMNQGIHVIDLLQWFMGPVVSVTARAGTFAHERIEVEDAAVALVQFASGALGAIVGTTAAFPGLHDRLEIYGTDGTGILEGARLRTLELRAERGEVHPYGEAPPSPPPLEKTGAPPVAGHAAQVADFVLALREGRPPAITGEEHRKSLEILMAIYRSARQGGTPVPLPLFG